MTATTTKAQTTVTEPTEGLVNDESFVIDGYHLVIGLEVHAELDTASKLFSPSANRFGDEPNTHIDPVTLGLPGALPVLNRRAVELAMRIGLALNCEIRPCTFHRKNYFYPDMPKAYQISQYDEPLNVNGWLELPDGTRIGIERAHLEEDTGKSTHVGGAGGRIHGSDYSLIDFNRAGVPLVEIVSRPDVRTPEQARQYVNELRAILVAIGASDAKMEEGSMRVDANVSVHLPDEPFGTRCEIKNLNSVRSLGRAVEYEARRQVALLPGEPVRQETRHWDEGDGRTHTLRSKEDADDYRYFLEPDLVPLVPDPEWVERVRAELPVLPAARRRRRRGERPARRLGSGDGGRRAWPGRLRARRRRGGRRRRRGPWSTSRRRTPSKERSPPCRRPTSPRSRPSRSDGRAHRARRRSRCSPRSSPTAVATRRRSPRRRGSRRWTPPPSRRSSTRRSPPTPAAWDKFVGGEDKAIGALVGAVMKASKGQADGKAVTALLNARRQAL